MDDRGPKKPPDSLEDRGDGVFRSRYGGEINADRFGLKGNAHCSRSFLKLLAFQSTRPVKDATLFVSFWDKDATWHMAVDDEKSQVSIHASRERAFSKRESSADKPVNARRRE